MALRTEFGIVDTANTNKDGSGTVTTLATATADATVLDVSILTMQTTTAGMVRIFVDNNLALEIPVPIHTVSGSAQGYAVTVRNPPFKVASGLVVTASTEVGEDIMVSITLQE